MKDVSVTFLAEGSASLVYKCSTKFENAYPQDAALKIYKDDNYSDSIVRVDYNEKYLETWKFVYKTFF